MKFDLLFADVTAVTMFGDNPVLKHAYLGVKDGKITYLDACRPEGEAKRTVSGTALTVMPGMTNAHTHVAMTLLRGYADDCALQPWLFDHIFPAEAKLDAEGVSAGSRLGMLEMFSNGITGLVDSYFFSPAIADVAEDVKMHAALTNMALWFGEGTVPMDDRSVREMREMIRRYPAGCGGFVSADAGIHAPNTSNPETWKWVRDFAGENGMRIHLHLAETAAERSLTLEKYGMSPTLAMAENGVFDVPVTAAHCVWLDENDIAVMAEYGVTAAHCPSSNMKLASGIAPVAKMWAAGVNVALGTDGVASNNAHDLFREMRLAAFLAKVKDADASVLPARNVLEMATVGGAAAAGRSGRSGRLCVGYDADIAVVDTDCPELTPCYDTVSNLVYAADGRNVVMTVSGGCVVYDHGDFPGQDIEKVKADVRQYSQRVLK